MTVSAWAGTLRDNFDDGNFDGWRLSKAGDQSAQWSVQNGELVGVAKNMCDPLIVGEMMIGDDTRKDYEVEGQFKIEQTFPIGCRGASLGISVRYDETSDSAADVWVYAAPNQVVWNLAGAERIVKGNADNPNGFRNLVTEMGKWYTMRVIVKGDLFEMFIDDVQVGDFQSDVPEKGAASVFAVNVEVHFDNIVISGDEIPNINMGLPVEPKSKLATTWAQVKRAQ